MSGAGRADAGAAGTSVPSDAPGLVARVRVPRAAFEVAADLTVGPGEVLCLLGPNGAGKSTVLAALAGLVAGPGTRVQLGDELLDDVDAGRHVAPPDRRVGLVFQDHRLFPHLTALENVAFGLRATGTRRQEAHRTAAEELARAGLAPLRDRRPSALSGGQAQRVALARALVVRPRLLLLDEPLAALDAEARVATRAVLREVLAGQPTPTVLVSHDPVDAVALADRVLVLDRGQVVQGGPPAAVLADPWSPYVASLAGGAVWRPERVDRDDEGWVATLAGGARVRSVRRAPGGPPRVVVPASAARLLVEGAATGTDALDGDVLRLEPRVTRLAVTVRLRQGGHELTVEADWSDGAAVRLLPGDRVGVLLDPLQVTVG
ncbi:ABC transporter ATP-binding protein [Frigoribacterium salinisoli]